MLRIFPRSVVLSLALAPAVLLTGCAADFAMPDASPVTQSSLGAIQGSNYGGHAPLVGAHVFLLQGATNGYNGKSTSLLQAGETVTDFYGSTYPTLLDATGSTSPTNGDYYVVTDSRGDFDLSNGYTCTPGLPVYIYAQGGNPETIPAVTLTQINSYTDTNNKTVVVFTTSGTNLAYQGELMNFSTFTTNTAYDSFSGATNQTVSPFYLTINTIGFELGSNITASLPQGVTVNATLTQATPIVSNPAVVNLAVLGICPSSGTANFSQLPFVYVNEVSTAAAAYALGGFFPAPGTAGLTNAGAAAANLSIPASDSLALLGLQNAAITADQIYDIAGSNVGAGGDGETHIARTTTPGVAVYANTTSGSATVSVGTSVGLMTGVTITGSGIPANTTITAINTGVTPNTITLSANATATASSVLLRAGAGNGTVPQALLNTVGNILANCVDSNNTYNPYTASGTASTQCTSLFGYAKSAGTTGTTPIDTASVAIDIAHNPWANVASLAALPTGNEPFQPTLSSVNDFSVGIQYAPAGLSNPEGLAIDAQGRVWYPNAGSAYVTTLTPFGAAQYNVNAGGSPDYVAIDGNGNAWFDNKNTLALQTINSTGTTLNTYLAGTLIGNEALSVDGVNDTGYIYAGKSGAPGSYGKYNNTGTAALAPLTGSENCMSNTNAHTATDNASNGYNLWVTGEAPDNVCIVNSTNGNLIHQITINAATGIGSSYQPEMPAIDVNGTAWIPNQHNASITKITQAGTATPIAVSTLNGGFGAAVDGAGNIFITSRANNVLPEVLGSTATPVSTTTFYGGGSTDLFSDPLNLQVDPSGNLWITNYAGSRIVELLGLAAPTWEPLSDAAYHNKLGSKP